MGHAARLLFASLALTCIVGGSAASAMLDPAKLSGPPHLIESDDLPAELGPVRQPDRVIEAPPELETSGAAFALLPAKPGEDPRALVTGRVTKANVWAFIVYFWPEILFLFLLLALLVMTWRVVRVLRRPQVAGAVMCRKCSYLLTGTTMKRGATCPECGAKLTARNMLRGRSRGRRLLIPLTVGSLLLISAGVLFYFWYPPRGQLGRWGADGKIARVGTFSERFDWPSASLWQWGQKSEFWPEMQTSHYGQAWVVNLVAGRFERQVLEYRETSGNVYAPLLGTPEIVHAQADAFLIDGDESIFRVDPVTGDSHLFAKHHWRNEDRLASFNLFTEDWLASADGRYLFQTFSTPRPMAWDTRTWKSPIHFPESGMDVDEYVTSLRPIDGGPWVLVRITDSPVKRTNERIRYWAWNPATNDLRRVVHPPLGWGTKLTFTSDLSMFVSERLVASEGRIDTWIQAWNPDELATPIDLIDERLEPTERQGMMLVAASKKPKEMFLYALPPEDKWYAWEIHANALRPIAEPKEADIAWWVRRPEEWKSSKLKMSTSSGPFIEVKREFDTKQVDRIDSPVQLWGEHHDGAGFSADGRFVFARAGQTTVVVYDRQTRRWLGRFDASTYASHRSYLNSMHIVANRWLIIETDEDHMKLLVFDLTRYLAGAKEPGTK